MMQSTAPAAAVVAPAAASRSLDALSALSIHDSTATSNPQQQQQQTQLDDEAPFVTVSSKKQRKKKAAASSSDASANSNSNGATTSSASTSTNGASTSNASSTNYSFAAARRKTTASAAASAATAKPKAKPKSFGNDRLMSAQPSRSLPTTASAAAIAAARAFVPTHVPAWRPNVMRVNDPTVPIAERLGLEMQSYCSYTRLRVAALKQSIDTAIAHISTCVQTLWPDATVTCYGSFASGLWLPTSDVDVVVMGLTNDRDPDVRTQFVVGTRELQQIASRLRSQHWVHRIDVVGTAKVPVAKLVLADDHALRVDISIENVHTKRGIDASALVREYVTAVPHLHALIVVVKQLLREKSLNSAFTGGLSSYAIALLAIYVFERQALLQADAYTSDSDTDDNQEDQHFRCSTDDSPAALGQLLLDFLEFYGMTFAYATTGISLKRDAFGEYYLAPHLLRSNGVALVPQLVLDDPVYLDGQHNAAAGAFAIARVIAAFENAFFAVAFHRPSKFTPTPLCQLLHWSGHAATTAAAATSATA